MRTTSHETWTGADGEVAGRIRIDAKRRETYVVRRSVGGQRYEVSTTKHSPAEAQAELAPSIQRFDPPPALD